MGPTIINEAIADQQVIRSLLRTIASMKGTRHMSKLTLFKDTDGAIKSVVSWEAVDREALLIDLKEAEQAVYTAKENLALYDSIAAVPEVAEPAPEAPAEEVVSEPVTEAPAPEVTPIEVPVVEVPEVITVNEQPVTVPADGQIVVDLTPEQPAETETPQPVEAAEPAPAPTIVLQ